MASISPTERQDAHRRQGYRVRWRQRQPDGGWASRSKTVYGRQAAQDLRAEMAANHEGAAGLSPTPGQETVADVARWFIDQYRNVPRERGKTVEPTSLEGAVREIKLLVEHLGPNRLWRTVTTADLQAFIDQRTNLRTGEPVKDKTRQRAVGVLCALTSDLLRAGKTTVNTGQGLRVRPDRPRGADDGRATIPTDEELRLVAEQLDTPTITYNNRWGGRTERPRWQRVHDTNLWHASDRLWLLAYTGLTFSEVRGLRPDDIDGRVITLRRTIVRRDDRPRDYGKSDARLDDRRIPVPAALEPVLERLTAYSQCGYLLTGPDGQLLVYETWRNQLRRAADAAGVELTTHLLRHFAASLWIESAAAAGREWRFAVMRFGGWSSLSMVERTYGHLRDDTLQAASADLDRLLEDVT